MKVDREPAPQESKQESSGHKTTVQLVLPLPISDDFQLKHCMKDSPTGSFVHELADTS